MAEKPGGRPSSAVPVTDIVEIRHRELNRLPRVHADPRSRWLSVLASLADPDLAAVDDLTVRQALRALADATVRARASDLECFARFCAGSGARGLPATRATIVAYADTLATAGQKVTSIQRKLSSIGVAHGMMGLENPCRSAAVHHAVRAIRKERGVARRQAFAVRLGDDTKALPSAITLRALLAACGDDPPEVRDAALLSIAYDGGLRASEVLAVRVEDIGALEDGSGTLWLSRSKTDQAGEGAFVYLSPETMQRVARWCDIATITGGTVFRQIQRRTRELSRGRPERPDVKLLGGGKFIVVETPAVPTLRRVSYLIPREDTPGSSRLSPQGLARIYRHAARRAADRGCIGLFGAELETAIAGFSTHGFRVGLTQDLFAEQFDVGQIQLAMRWKSPTTALGYARKLRAGDNAASQFLRTRRPARAET